MGIFPNARSGWRGVCGFRSPLLFLGIFFVLLVFSVLNVKKSRFLERIFYVNEYEFSLVFVYAG